MATPPGELYIKRQFGARLKTFRDEAGLSQEQLAELAGLHRTYVGSVERGERNLALRAIVQLAVALDTEVSELLGSDFVSAARAREKSKKVIRKRS